VNKVILNWQRPLWEGDHEVVKRSGRVEPTWVSIHKCMEVSLRISLYSYFYLKLTYTVFLIISYLVSSTKSEKRTEQVCLEAGGEDAEEGGGW
jgi:hypothetical protein